MAGIPSVVYKIVTPLAKRAKDTCKIVVLPDGSMRSCGKNGLRTPTYKDLQKFKMSLKNIKILKYIGDSHKSLTYKELQSAINENEYGTLFKKIRERWQVLKPLSRGWTGKKKLPEAKSVAPEVKADAKPQLFSNELPILTDDIKKFVTPLCAKEVAQPKREMQVTEIILGITSGKGIRSGIAQTLVDAAKIYHSEPIIRGLKERRMQRLFERNASNLKGIDYVGIGGKYFETASLNNNLFVSAWRFAKQITKYASGKIASIL